MSDPTAAHMLVTPLSTELPLEANCSVRYAHNSTNLSPVSVEDRYDVCRALIAYGTTVTTLNRIIMPIWLVVGLLGNTLSFVIWISKKQRQKNTSAIYLAALALSDLILTILLLNYQLEAFWCLPGLTSLPVLCQAYQTLFLFTQYYSITLVFGFTLERYLAICFPFQRKTLCSSRRALLAVGILGLIVSGPAIFSGVQWVYDDGKCFMSEQWPATSKPLNLIQEIVFSLVVPLATLVFNLLVLRELHRIRRSRTGKSLIPKLSNMTRKRAQKRLDEPAQPNSPTNTWTSTLDGDEEHESSSFTAVTLMLMILSFYLIMCSVPPGIAYQVQFHMDKADECLSDEAIKHDPLWSKAILMSQTKAIIDLLCSSHYACNILIYLLTCRGFRQHALKMLTCKCRKSRQSLDYSSTFSRRRGPSGLLSDRSGDTDTIVHRGDGLRPRSSINLNNHRLTSTSDLKEEQMTFTRSTNS